MRYVNVGFSGVFQTHVVTAFCAQASIVCLALPRNLSPGIWIVTSWLKLSLARLEVLLTGVI